MFTLEMTNTIFFLSIIRVNDVLGSYPKCDFVNKYLNRRPVLCCNDVKDSQFDTMNSCQYEMD